MDIIPYAKHEITDEDIGAVVSVLKNKALTQGSIVPQFEEQIKKLTGVKYAVAVNSATSALHIACLALEIGLGDLVWTSPISFVASSNCVLYCGASIDFVDIDPETLCISVDALEKKLKHARYNNLKLPKALVAVDLGGQSCSFEQIHLLALEFGFKIIEDASHAIGGRYQGELIGSCRYSDITVYSFHPAKIITTGEGGMALTNSQQLAEKMILFRTHGITRNPDQMEGRPHGPWYYQQILLGFNYRMSDIHASLGISQINRLHKYVTERNLIANRYDELLSNCDLKLQTVPVDTYSSRHLYIIGVKKNIHKRLFEYFLSNNIGVNLHYIPIHMQPYYRKLGFSVGQFPFAESYYESAISLPIFPTLTIPEQDKVIRVLKEGLE